MASLLCQVIEGTDQLSWVQYLVAMRERFALNRYEDPMAKLVTLKQIGTVD